MGTWGYRAFENDAAMDFLAELEESSRKGGLLVRYFRGLKTTSANADVGAMVIAAAHIIAGAVDGQTSEKLSPELVNWLLSREVAERQEWGRCAAVAVESILQQSELKELWGESDEASKWREEIEGLGLRLRAEPISTRAKRRRAPSQRRKWLVGDVFRLALPNREYVWGRMYEPDHFGIYNVFSVDPGANPVGMRDFFLFSRVYRTEYRRAEMEYVGQDPFGPEERKWRPFFSLEFPHFGWTRVDGGDDLGLMATTDEVVGLSPDLIRTLESLTNLLVNRDNPLYASHLYPMLPDLDGKNVPKPWSAWQGIRARLVKEHGEDFENIRCKKKMGYSRPFRGVALPN